MAERDMYDAVICCDEDGNPILVEGCYIFKTFGGTEEKQFNVPECMVDFTKDMSIQPLSETAAVRLFLNEPILIQTSRPSLGLSSANTCQTAAALPMMSELLEEPTMTSSEEPTVAEWGDNASKLLLALYAEKKGLVESRKIKTLKKMWEIIKEGLANHGYTYSSTQCESKWKALERAYKKMLENKNSTGRGRRSCPYEKELSEILSKRHSLFPVVTMGTGNPNVQETFSAASTSNTSTASSPGSASDNSSPNDTSQPVIIHHSKKKKTDLNITPLRGSSSTDELRKIREAIEYRNKIKADMEEKKMKHKAEIIEQLKIKNELLRKYFTKDNSN